MARHLIGGGPGRRDVLTECCLDEALPGTLMTEIGGVDCADCIASLIRRNICPECGTPDTLTWSSCPKKLTPVVDGRLRLNEVTAIFYLGCDYCSATVIPEVGLDTIAAYLTSEKWTP